MNNNIKIAQFGSWKSPITSDLIVAGTVGIGAVTIDNNNIYWLEARPTEKGRNVLVKRTPDGTITDVTPAPFNVRTRVHEYGGGAFLVADGTVFFVNFSDQRLYQQKLDGTPEPLTPESQQRYADMCLDQERNRLIGVGENHSQGNHEPENNLVSIDLNSGEVKVLVSGADFYSSPRISPDGKKLTWYSWNHPNLPWDGTELWIAKINADGSLSDSELIAGGKNESICEPKWSPDGSLYFSSDKTGWWNLYRRNIEGEIEPLYTMEAEFGYPHWVFGGSIYDFVNLEEIICTYTQNGSWYLASLNTKTKQLKIIDTPYTSIGNLQVSNNKIVFIGGSPTEPTAVVKLDLESVIPPPTKGGLGGVNNPKIEVLKQSSNLEIDSGYLSTPEAIAFPTENGLTAYGWYYPPQNKDYSPPSGNLPPLLVKSHGGPTSAASATFNLRIQYWTSRGFAFLDVNYGGSTGYGRAYRERLNGKWGIVDVDDCVNGAKYLVEAKKVDGEKLAIAGGSAGGYTTLAALTFRDTFKAGASYYGVSDLEALAKDTHKFEARYLDNLIGKYPAEKEIYERRSPINYTDKLSCPVIFFQGLEDKVVPPNQAETMVDALKAKGITVAYVPFEGEQHGFRQAENIKKALDGEFEFYANVFGF